MKTTIAAMAITALTASALHAQTIAAPSANVAFTSQSIKIDGRLDDLAWKDASTIALDKTYDGKASTFPATVRLMWGKNWLYLGAEVPDERVVAGRLPRDGFLWEKDDVLELFLWPREDQPYYYEIVVNPRGTLYDAFFVAKPTHDGPELTLSDWNPDIRVQNRLAPMLYRPDKIGAAADKGYWNVEMAIPIASLSSRGGIPPAAGESWRAQINRYNRPDAGPGMLDATAWAQYDKLGEPHLLNTFGTLTLVGGPTPAVPPVVPESDVVSATPPNLTAAPAVVPTSVPVAPVPEPTPTPAPPVPAVTPAPVAPEPAASPKLLSVDFKDMQIRDALDTLFRNTGRAYNLTPEAAQASPTVTVNVERKTFEQALLDLVNAAKLQYNIDAATGVYSIEPAKTGDDDITSSPPAAPDTAPAPATPDAPAPNTPPGQ
jgi:hypothetical protein